MEAEYASLYTSRSRCVRIFFAKLRLLAVAEGVAGLSMGMSGDFTIAIEEGATIVRIGSRLFA